MFRPGRSIRFAPSYALLVVAAVLAVTACSGSSDADPPTADDITTSSRPATTTTSTSSPQEDSRASATERYLLITQRYYERLRVPDPTDPTIDDDFTGASRDGVVDRARTLQTAGHADRPSSAGFPVPTVTNVKVGKGTAVVSSCLVDDVEIVDVQTGQTINNDVFTQVLETTLVKAGGDWKIRDQSLVSESPGRTGCGP